MSYRKLLLRPSGLLILTICILSFSACNDHDSNGPPTSVYADETDFQDSIDTAIQLREGFTIDLWAPGPLIANAVSISMDHQGAAYVTETQRRKSSDLDIRAHRDWMIEDLSLQDLEDTREFHLNKLAPENSPQNSWLDDFNEDGVHDWRDLMVQSEYVRKIWDSNGDGKADTSTEFASGFNEMLSGVAAGVLHHNQDVYLAVAPDVYKLNDLDGDGDADQREVISHGFGIHIAYAGHDMSGLIMGPDGKLYWSVGDIGVNAQDQEGNRYFYPNQGAVMRCNPDGSDFEVFAHGLRNPQELAFDAFGNLISVDNDGDHPGEHERYVHILEGSDSGWRTNWQFGKYHLPNEQYKVWTDEQLHLPYFQGQAAYILPTIGLAPDGPAGLVYQPGTALNDEWDDYFFASYFKGSTAKSEIQAFKLKPNGASYMVDRAEKILSGVVNTGLDFGPDGALYINDWLETYDKKTVGRIWRLDVNNSNESQRNKTKELLADGMNSKSTEELADLLSYGDQRVRLSAQYELVDRQNQEALIQILSSDVTLIAKIHAIWGLGQMARVDNQVCQSIMPYLRHEDPEIRAQSAKVLGDAKFRGAADELLSKLSDASARVKYFSVEALGKIKEERAFQPMIDLLSEIGTSDPHLRHGLIYALFKLGMENELVELRQHQSAEVRIAAVVALRRLKSPSLALFLQDTDSLVLLETARAIHDDQSVPEALEVLAKSLTTESLDNEVFIRRAINANLRIGDAASALRLSSYASEENNPTAMRTDALWALGYWPNPPLLDRVEGRYRKLDGRPLEDAHHAIAAMGRSLLYHRDMSIRVAAIELVGRLQYSDAEQLLTAFCLGKSEPLSVRKTALKSLKELNSASMEKVITELLDDRHMSLRTDALAMIASLNLPSDFVLSTIDRVLKENTVLEKQQVLLSLSKLQTPEAEIMLKRLLEDLTEGSLDPPIQLDLINAINNSSFQDLKDQLKLFEEGRKQLPPIEQYQESLLGGQSENGKRLFYQNNTAQCIRCHKLGELGGDVGPNLAGIASKLDNRQLLEALIDPSKRLAPNYGTVSLELLNGTKVTGVLLSDSPDFIKVRSAEGNEADYSTDQIKSKTFFPSSMPSMQGILSKAEIRDLMAFLKKQN